VLPPPIIMASASSSKGIQCCLSMLGMAVSIKNAHGFPAKLGVFLEILPGVCAPGGHGINGRRDKSDSRLTDRFVHDRLKRAANTLICNAVGRQEQLHNVSTCPDQAPQSILMTLPVRALALSEATKLATLLNSSSVGNLLSMVVSAKPTKASSALMPRPEAYLRNDS
jgi:hypothetical protein